MANIDEQRAGRTALRAAQNKSADGADPSVGWTAQQKGPSPTALRTEGVPVTAPNAFIAGAEPEDAEGEVAYTREELKGMTVPQLKNVADGQGVEYASNVVKDDLIDAILEDQTAVFEDEDDELGQADEDDTEE